MAVRATRWLRAVAHPALAGLWLGAFLVGCGGQSPEPEKSAQGQRKSPPTAAIPPSAPSAAQKPPPAAAPGAPAAQPARSTFKDAVLLELPDDAPPQSFPDRTRAGKSVGKLFEQITAPGGLWDQVALATPDGKKLAHTATIKTQLGVIRIELWPDVAPNHVRNFVALARAGYYDGLQFDHTVRDQLPDEEPARFFEMLVAGCPVGTGDPAYGSIGYWLKTEISDTLTHDEGTVGAWHGEVLETAACKFYITLSKAPSMDGFFTIFGKVTQGLDVARNILTRPTREEGFRERPVQPVVIESVTVESRVAEPAAKR
jgi:peptidyl-prolyl cis-trans isomerase B (cyclophilin B)